MTALYRATKRHRPDLTDLVDELTRPHTNRARYEARKRTRYNQVRVPSLLHQLEHAIPTSTSAERSTAGYASRPTANLDALSTLQRIDLEVTLRLEQLGASTDVDRARRRSLTSVVTARLLRLHGLLPETRLADAPFARALERDVRRWYASARIMTGWDVPAWKPDNTCPACGHHGSLRVRWHEEVALCIECSEAWDPDTIGMLAEHIRLEAAFERTKPAVPPCYCPLPQPTVTTLRLCPSCGSARCVRALRQPYDTQVTKSDGS